MFDRASFWSPVPEWAQARLERPLVRVAVREFATLWLVSGNTMPFLQRHGLANARGPREAIETGSCALRLAPDRLLFVSDRAHEGDFGWSADGCAVSDVGSGFVCIELSGQGARDLLARAGEYAFESKAERPQESTQTMLGGFRVILARHADGWLLFVERPWAAALWRWLERNLELGSRT